MLQAIIPPNGAIPPLGTEFHTGTSVLYPITHFATRDMKSIATGPLSQRVYVEKVYVFFRPLFFF